MPRFVTTALPCGALPKKGTTMGIGAAVALIATGAVLTFATDWYVAGIDLNAVGVILMIAGAIGLAVTVQVFRPRSQSGAGRTPREPYHPQAGHYAQQPPPPAGGHYPPQAGHYPQNPPPGGYR